MQSSESTVRGQPSTDDGPRPNLPKPPFSAGFYLAHFYFTLHILIGLTTEGFKLLTTGHYRLVGIATWPWTITGRMEPLIISIVLHAAALLHVALQIRNRLDTYPINLRTMGIYVIFILSLQIQIIRFFAWLIGI
ncbi:MAG: hypothetical protein N2110_01190 [Flavobacteriales bacterium]|nr:hypothetical protein [Flavobacteriales bacterium]